MRLIDADALINTLDAEKDRLAKAKENRYAAQIICDLERVRTAPTIEAEPIRHGKWKKVSDKNREEAFKKRMADIDIRDFKANMKAKAIKQRRKAGKIKRK